MGFLKDLKKKVRSQAFTMAEQPRSLPPMMPRSGFNPFRDPLREDRRPRPTTVNPGIQSVRDLVIENINTGALPPEGMSMPTAPNEAGLMPLPRPRDKFKPRNKFMPGRFPTRLPRVMPERMPSRFPSGGLGSFLERIFSQLERQDESPRLPMPEDMPRERFPMMRPGFAEGEEVNMNMRIADLGASQGMAPAEQRMMLLQKTAADMGRTISDKDAQLFGMGEISFEEAMSRARPSMDQVSGERNLMQQEQMFFPEKKSFRDSQQAFKGTPLGDALSYVPDLMQVADYMGLKNFAKGGEAFPDLTGDGQVTQADILKGRGVFAEGDEVSAGPDDIQSALSDIESVAPEAQAIQQVMTMVMELVQSGASEEEIIAALRQMGLDDEDIQQVMMMLAEQMQSQQDPIQAELSQMS
jgi:hypothetical protein